MSVELFIARRYLLSRKSHHAINIVSGISVAGVAVATMALVCTLSVFNGFRDLVAGLFTAFDPELRVTLAEGESAAADDPALRRLRRSPLVAACTDRLEGQALVAWGGRQRAVTVMGVADNFERQSGIKDILYGDGSFCLHADVLEYGVPGIQLASDMGLSAHFEDPLQVYAPKRGERVNMANPLGSFNHGELQSPGVVFMVKQSKYDSDYVLTSLSFARRLFDMEGRVTSVGVRLRRGVSAARAKRELRRELGAGFRVEDRWEQQADVFRIMRVEKLVSYLFLTLVLLVACFNIVGSLSMLMIDKREDARSLRAMGASERQVRRVFMLEGRLISLAGAALGLVLGLALCWAQRRFGLVTMGQSEGSFLVEAYPVSVEAGDLAAVFLTVLAASWAAMWYPVRRLAGRLL